MLASARTSWYNMDVMKSLIYILAAAVVFTASCAVNKPVEKKSAKKTEAEPVGESRQGEITPEPDNASEKPAEAPEPTRELTREEFDDFKAVGMAMAESHKLYRDYFTKKERGTVDTVLLDQAITKLDAVIAKIEKLIDKYPDSPMLQESLSTATMDRRSLQLWKE